MTKTAAIYLIELDLIRLENVADYAGSDSPLAGLVGDLTARANATPDNKTLADVVAMNSIVCVVNDTSVEQGWTLVYPGGANVISAKLSVFSSTGAVLLDVCTGRSAKYSTPNGAQRSPHIGRVAFQLEVADRHTL